MSEHTLIVDASLPEGLRNLFSSAEGADFEHALDSLLKQREQHLFRALGVLARDLHDAVGRLGGDLAQEGVPSSVDEALRKLEEVLDISAKGAHRSMEIAENTRANYEALATKADAILKEPLPDVFASHALAKDVLALRDHVKAGNTEIVLAQSWQDLSGQRIKKVATFIGSVQKSLLELVSLTGAIAKGDLTEKGVTIHSQQEADDLLKELGL